MKSLYKGLSTVLQNLWWCTDQNLTIFWSKFFKISTMGKNKSIVAQEIARDERKSQSLSSSREFAHINSWTARLFLEGVGLCFILRRMRKPANNRANHSCFHLDHRGWNAWIIVFWGSHAKCIQSGVDRTTTAQLRLWGQRLFAFKPLQRKCYFNCISTTVKIAFWRKKSYLTRFWRKAANYIEAI